MKSLALLMGGGHPGRRRGGAGFPLITADPGTLFGKPRIRDTRISVAHILELVADGATVAEIVEGWPELTREAVEQAIRYAAAVLAFPAAKRIAVEVPRAPFPS